MQSVGYIELRAYTSNAQIPLPDTAVAITSTDGTAIALRATDRSGKILPVSIPVPERSESLSPDPEEVPYSLVNIYAYKEGYEQVEAENVQIFAGTTTVQDLAMVPLSELPEQWSQSVIFDTPPQNL